MTTSKGRARRGKERPPVRLNPMLSAGEILAFITSEPATRRWHVARIFGEEEGNPAADLFFARATKKGEKALRPAGGDLAALEEESLDWWHGEDYDHGAHLPMPELRRLLSEHGDLGESQDLVEGAVFVELWQGKDFRFVGFHHQARAASREIYRRLLEG